MNLSLLDPFRRQIPDRIDSTLTLPRHYHPRRLNDKDTLLTAEDSNKDATEDDLQNVTTEKRAKTESGSNFQETSRLGVSSEKDDDEDDDELEEEKNVWHSCYSLSFNRRGSYLAAGHASAAVPIHDFASRTLSCIYHPFGDTSNNSDNNKNSSQKTRGSLPHYKNGITSITWSKRSRTLLVASHGNADLSLLDNTNRLGPVDVNVGTSSKKKNGYCQGNAVSRSNSPVPSDLSKKNVQRKSTGAVEDEEAGLETAVSNASQARIRRISHLRVLELDGDTKDSSSIPRLTNSTVIYDDEEMEGNLKKKAKKEEKAELKEADLSLSQEGSASRSLPSIRYQTLVLTLPRPVGGSVEIDSEGFGGLACLDDGSLVLYRFPQSAFYEHPVCSIDEIDMESGAEERQSNLSESTVEKGSLLYLVPPPNMQGNKYGGKVYYIMCAAFGKNADVVFAATKCGTFLSFRINSALKEALIDLSTMTTDESLKRTGTMSATERPSLETVHVKCDPINPSFNIKIAEGVKTTEIVSSRNCRMVLLNSSDNILRLYDTDECWKLGEKKLINTEESGKSNTIEMPQHLKSIKPRFMFQDVVSKAHWTSCDFSGDGEYVVGGCNSEAGDKYELYLWNTVTGALLDQLTGPQVSLYSLSWHPTRSFIAVGTSDGIVDIWGPRMDWTAFAPDFQALQKNIEYIEREDEFDTVMDRDEVEKIKKKELTDKIEEQEIVDVVGVDKVKAFSSDSEDESSVFYFTLHSRGG